MSTKRLSKTVIEGGRYGRNKFDRRQSHVEVRAQERDYLKAVVTDLEHCEEYDIDKPRPVYQGFTDKLAPMYRWIEAQVGLPWDEVHSKVIQTFDTRTTAGRHIVYDHMLDSVEVTPKVHRRHYSNPDDLTTSYSDNDFYVDSEGIPRKKRYLGRRRWSDNIPYFNTNQIANWLSGRVVGKVGSKFFWFVPVGKGKKHRNFYGGHHIWDTQWINPYSYSAIGPQFIYLYYESIYKLDGNGVKILDDKGAPIVLDRVAKWVSGSPASLRQDRKLNEKEMEFWDTIPTWHQTKVLELSPNYPIPPKQPAYPYYR